LQFFFLCRSRIHLCGGVRRIQAEKIIAAEQDIEGRKGLEVSENGE